MLQCASRPCSASWEVTETAQNLKKPVRPYNMCVCLCKLRAESVFLQDLHQRVQVSLGLSTELSCQLASSLERMGRSRRLYTEGPLSCPKTTHTNTYFKHALCLPDFRHHTRKNTELGRRAIWGMNRIEFDQFYMIKAYFCVHWHSFRLPSQRLQTSATHFQHCVYVMHVFFSQAKPELSTVQNKHQRKTFLQLWIEV